MKPFKRCPVMIAVITMLYMAVIVFGISFGCSIIENMYFSVNFFLDRGFVIQTFSKKEAQQIAKRLENQSYLAMVVKGSAQRAKTPMIFLTSGGTYKIGIEKKDFEAIKQALNIELKEGQFPSNEDEILISEQVANHVHVAVGEWIRDEKNPELSLQKDYKVSGIIKTTGNIYMTLPEKNANELMLFFKDHNRSDVFCRIENILKEEKVSYKIDAMNDEFMQVFLKNLRILGGMGMSFLLIGLLAACHFLGNNYFENTKEEYQFLYNIGYSYKTIKRRAEYEYMVMIIMGTIAGILVGEIGVILFKYLYAVPKGYPYVLWNKKYVTMTFLIMFNLIIGTYLQVSQNLKKGLSR